MRKLNYIARFIQIISISILLNSCVKPFSPKLDNNSINKFVVQGMVSSIEGYQTVVVSRTSGTSLAEFLPVEGCELTIVDDLGNSFQLEYWEDGVYAVWMNASDLVPGRAYKVSVKTPSGEVLESDFDIMPEGPDEMGDLYWDIANIQTDDPEVILTGVQFYTDFEAGPDDGKYYRWRCTETYEYHTQYPLEFYYSYNGVNQVSPPDSSMMVCYRTDVIENVFSLSTINLSPPVYNALPLNFVRNNTDKMAILYSLLVEQISMSVEAFNFWDKLRINLDQSGGLYTSQPLSIKGNINNLSNADNEVLGFFQASTVAAKRIFVEAPVPGLELDYYDLCIINPLRFGFAEIPQNQYPAYLFSSGGSWTYSVMTKECVDCTLAGGVTEKPVFWPN
jgi:hypothetical protein